jgi:hypothetical protein
MTQKYGAKVRWLVGRRRSDLLWLLLAGHYFEPLTLLLFCCEARSAEEIPNLLPSRVPGFDSHNLWPLNHLQVVKTRMASVY